MIDGEDTKTVFPDSGSGKGLGGMPEDVRSLKKRLRRYFLSERASLTPVFRRQADEAIFRSVTGLPEFRNARIVAGYATDGTEPDVLPILKKAQQQGAAVCLPKWNGTEYIMSLLRTGGIDGLVPGKWGLPEPVTTDPLPADAEGILFLIPGVAFDDAFMRLGRGGGIYDRFLHARRHSIALGVFYECQHCPALPSEGHDEKLDLIVTETGVRKNTSAQIIIGVGK